MSKTRTMLLDAAVELAEQVHQAVIEANDADAQLEMDACAGAIYNQVHAALDHAADLLEVLEVVARRERLE